MELSHRTRPDDLGNGLATHRIRFRRVLTARLGRIIVYPHANRLRLVLLPSAFLFLSSSTPC